MNITWYNIESIQICSDIHLRQCNEIARLYFDEVTLAIDDRQLSAFVELAFGKMKRKLVNSENKSALSSGPTYVARSPPASAILFEKCFIRCFFVFVIASCYTARSDDDFASGVRLVIYSIAAFFPVFQSQFSSFDYGELWVEKKFHYWISMIRND